MDISNKLAIINTNEYENKMFECINNTNCGEVKKNPLSIINKTVTELGNKGSQNY